MPTRIGPYQIQHPLGRGATGITYAAVHIQTEQQVALKVMQPLRIAPTVEIALQRFTTSARHLRALKHPGVVHLFDAGKVQVPTLGECFYLAMERLEGESLARALRRGPFFVPEAAAIIIQVAQILHECHQRGVVHGDLRPATVFVTREPRVVLMDFGLVEVDGNKLISAQGSFASIAPYLAPEQLLGGKSDARSDVFALGTLLYGLLTCGLLRPISSPVELVAALQAGRESSRARLLQGVDPALTKILMHALAQDPTRRFQTALDMARALQPLAGAFPPRYPDRVAAPAPKLDVPSEESEAYRMPGLDVEEAQTSAPVSQPALAPVSAPRLDPRAVMDFIMAEVPVDHTQDDEEHAKGAAPHLLAAMDVVQDKGSRRESEQLAVDYFGRTDELVAELKSRDQPHAAPQIRLTRSREQLSSLAPDLERPIRIIRIPKVQIAGGLVAVAMVIAGWWFTRSIELLVTSNPPGAEVLVDGQSVGSTPARLHARRHRTLEIVVRASGYKDTTRTVPMISLKETTLRFALSVLPARMTLESSPPGALVSVDGSGVCRTPCQVPDLEPDRMHTIVLNAEGCEPLSLLLRAKPGEVLERTVELRALSLESLSLLQVFADKQPLYVDDVMLFGSAERVQFFVPPGKHTLRVGTRGEVRRLALAPASVEKVDLRREDPDLERGGGVQPDRMANARDRAEIEVAYGLTLAAEGQQGEARSALEKALQLDPESLSVHRALLALAAMQKKPAEALRHIEAFETYALSEVDLPLVRSVGAVLRGQTTCGAPPK
ncbi:MAG: PEGA domain-containing protein [Pseudomonadota bacterium]